MPWQTISADEVLSEFTAVEAATLNGIQGTATALADILPRVVNAARGNIQAGGNTLGPAATIPDQLRGEVIALARWRWLQSFPSLKSMQSDVRKNAATDAQSLLNLIASQKPDRPRVENPDGTSPLTSPSIKPHRRMMTDRSQEGL